MHVDYVEKMEPKHNAQSKSSPVFLPAQRDVRGSLEVFNPSSNEVTAPFRPQPTWRTWTESPQNNTVPAPTISTSEDLNVNVGISSSHSGRLPTDEIKSWMALKDPNPNDTPPAFIQPHSPPFVKGTGVAPQSPGGIVGAAEQRAAEWGLVLQTDTETGKPQGVKVRTSGEDPSAKPGSSRRDSGNSVQSDVSDDGTGKY